MDKLQYRYVVKGKKTRRLVLDIQKKDPSKEAHRWKADGIEFYNFEYGPVTNKDTVTKHKSDGGFYKIYDVNDDKYHIESGPLYPHVLIDVLYDGKGYVLGNGRELGHIGDISQSPVVNVNIDQSVKYNKCIVNNTHVSTSSAHVNAHALASSAPVNNDHDTVRALNDALGSDIDWIVSKIGNVYKLFPETDQCCVCTDEVHSTRVSCVNVHKSSVVLSCEFHGNRVLSGDLSRSIREIFFSYNTKAPSAVADMVCQLAQFAKSGHLVRHRGSVYKRAGFLSYACSYEKMLKDAFPNSTALMDKPKRLDELMTFMRGVSHPGFPFVERNRRYICFSNGLLDVINGELVDDSVLGEHDAPRHYIDQPYDVDDLDTPMFDQIVKYQLQDDEVYTYMLALIGRLFYGVGQFDNLDITPFIIGDTSTGKSTLASIIAAMFDPGSVGTMDSRQEIVFGLQSMYDKELIVAPEISDRMVNQLSSDIFKKMVCGEAVNVAVKHKESHTVQWNVPLFMCGNQHLSFRDDRGSISRRLAIFKFDKYVAKVDRSMKDKIICTELSKIAVKSMIAYRQLIDYTKSSSFWSTCPDYFKTNVDDMSGCTDYIYMFLSLGPNDNVWGSRYMYFIHDPGYFMPMEEFKTKFYNWLRFKHQNAKHRWTHDYSAFKRKGFEIAETKVCKRCGLESFKGCCPYYSQKNRSTQIRIKNIRCVEGDHDAD